MIAVHLGVATPINTDVHGEVDLSFTTVDGAKAAAEVTFLTDEDAHGNEVARRRESARPYRPTTLTKAWNVTVAEDRARYRGLRERLEPRLAVLEAAGVEELSWLRSEMHNAEFLERVRAAVWALAGEGVEQAWVLPDPPDRALEPAIFISASGGYSSSGSAAALEEIESYISERIDNLDKLTAADADERHLFIWLDLRTPGEIAAPFISTHAAEWYHFGLPARPPALPEPITHLWVVHHSTRRGWVYSPSGGWVSLADGSASAP